MQSRPNVIIIMADSFRPDFIGAYGNQWIKTPNLDRLADISAVFTRTYAEFPITVPSRTAIVTGNYTFTNRQWIPLKDEDVTIAQIASDNGYRTVAFSDSPMNPWSNLNKGFQQFNWFPGGKVMPLVNPDSQPLPDNVEWTEASNDEDREIYYRTSQNRAEYLEKHSEYFPEFLAHRVTEWIESDTEEQPFFLWVDFFDPHEPWDPPSPYKEMYDANFDGSRISMPGHELSEEDCRRVKMQYAGCCTQVDTSIGEILNALESKGLLESSIVIFLSDHGEPFGEHGVVRKFNPVLYDELVKIPLMIHVPGMRTGNIDSLVQNVDIAPTICSLLGWDHSKMDGEELTPILKREADKIRTRAWIGNFGMRSGVVTEQYKYIDNRGEKENELYDLEQDPWERRNIAHLQPETASKLAHELWEFTGSWGIWFVWRNGPGNVHEMSKQ